jgi:AcrR family transcriptional regulator
MTTEKRRPGRPSLSTQQKEDIKENIISIARALFVEEGYENTSMRKIAARAGFAPTKIYYYFDNKKAILKHFWNDISMDMWRHVKPDQQIMSQPPVTIIRHLMRQSVEYWLDNPNNYQLSIETQDFRAAPSENFDMYNTPGTRDYVSLMRTLVDRCVEQGVFKNIDTIIISQLLAISVYGIYGSFYNLPSIAWHDKEQLIELAIENSLNGLMLPVIERDSCPA